MGKNQYFEFWLLIFLFYFFFNLGKFGDCCFEATSDSERRISNKSCYFLFIFSEIYDNTYVFLRSNFDNFSWKSEDISILKGFWKEKATMFVIEIWLLWLQEGKLQIMNRGIFKPSWDLPVQIQQNKH